MLQHAEPQDFVLATGEAHTVREFVEAAAEHLDFDIEWSGWGEHERGIDRRSGRVIVRVNPAFYRPAEVDLLIGDPSKACRVLGWERKIGFRLLVAMMTEADARRVRDDFEHRGPCRGLAGLAPRRRPSRFCFQRKLDPGSWRRERRTTRGITLRRYRDRDRGSARCG